MQETCSAEGFICDIHQESMSSGCFCSLQTPHTLCIRAVSAPFWPPPSGKLPPGGSSAPLCIKYQNQHKIQPFSFKKHVSLCPLCSSLMDCISWSRGMGLDLLCCGYCCSLSSPNSCRTSYSGDYSQLIGVLCS